MNIDLKKNILNNNIVMSKKVDLYKLSPQELLAYAQNLVKQTEKVKQQPKPVKPKKSIKITPSTKLSQILSSSGKVLNYPKKIVSIADMRDEELNMTYAPGKLKLTFVELFERRFLLFYFILFYYFATHNELQAE